MEFIDFLKTSFNTLMANKTRSFLTTLGIVIGISSVIVMVSIGSGAQKLIVNRISAMGSNTIFIEPGAFDPKKSSMTQTAIEEAEVKTLKYSDALQILIEMGFTLRMPSIKVLKCLSQKRQI